MVGCCMYWKNSHELQNILWQSPNKNQNFVFSLSLEDMDAKSKFWWFYHWEIKYVRKSVVESRISGYGCKKMKVIRKSLYNVVLSFQNFILMHAFRVTATFDTPTGLNPFFLRF